MELTLVLPPGDAARLPRLPIVKPARTGRSRGQAARIVWHDTLDRALAADGLSLAEERGVWRLERHRPTPSDPWPPATDHRLIEEAAGPAAFHHSLPDALTPVAAFEGRRTVIALTIDDAPVTMTILTGTLRAVAAEQPVARLILDGPAAQPLALALAREVGLAVPGWCLAAEARRLADGVAPAPRRLGPPVLASGAMTVEAAFAHIIGHLTDVILHFAPLVADSDSGPEPVHQMRVAVRRARSALSLFPSFAKRAGTEGSGPQGTDPQGTGPQGTGPQGTGPQGTSTEGTGIAEGLKHLGHMLGPARDWDVFMTETAPPVEAAMPEHTDLRGLLRTGTRRRRATRAALAAYLTGDAFRRLSLELACAAAADPPAETAEARPLTGFAASVLDARWKKLLKNGRALDELDSQGLHKLRLKAKRLRYAAEFFATLFPGKPTTRFIQRLSALQERLGEFNDTAAASTLLRELNAKPGYAAGLILGFTASRATRARDKIASAWAKFRRRDAFWGDD